MAGDWIPISTDLWDCPEVMQLASAICPRLVRNVSASCPQNVHKMSELVRNPSANCPSVSAACPTALDGMSEKEVSKCVVIGALCRTWALFDRFTVDGVLHGYDADTLDSQVGIKGWTENLAHVGWMTIAPQSLTMPRFTTWLGTSAKRRIKDAQRKRDERIDSQRLGENVSASCPQNVRNDSDKKRTTGDDIRGNEITEEKKERAPTPRRSFDPVSVELPFHTKAFSEAWALWCQHLGEKRKRPTPTATAQQLAKLESLGESRAIDALRHSVANGYQGIYEPQGATKSNSGDLVIDPATFM